MLPGIEIFNFFLFLTTLNHSLMFKNYTVGSSIFRKLYLRPVFDFLLFYTFKNDTQGLSKTGISFYSLGLRVRPNIPTPPSPFIRSVPPPREVVLL